MVIDFGPEKISLYQLFLYILWEL